jgi:hypothetical protein
MTTVSLISRERMINRVASDTLVLVLVLVLLSAAPQTLSAPPLPFESLQLDTSVCSSYNCVLEYGGFPTTTIWCAAIPQRPNSCRLSFKKSPTWKRRNEGKGQRCNAPKHKCEKRTT